MGKQQLWVTTGPALALATLATILSIAIGCSTMYQHLLHFTRPDQQRYIVRILAICPLYSVCSFLSLAFARNAVYFEVVRDVYEAVIIYSFMVLILEFAGGESNCVAKMQHRPPLRLPLPCCCVTRARTGRLMRTCKQCTLQFVIVKPLMALLSLVMLTTGSYYATTYQTFELSVYNISYTLALYYLLVFYLATKEVIGKFHPVIKFAAVKSIVFATYYQSLLILLLPGVSTADALLWSDFILCIEMVGFSLMLRCAFSHEAYVTGIPSSSELLRNASTVITVRDVMQDAYHNFMPAYQEYVLQRDEHQAPEKIRTRTYIVGNINIPGLKSNAYKRTDRADSGEIEMDDSIGIAELPAAPSFEPDTDLLPPIRPPAVSSAQSQSLPPRSTSWPCTDSSRGASDNPEGSAAVALPRCMAQQAEMGRFEDRPSDNESASNNPLQTRDPAASGVPRL